MGKNSSWILIIFLFSTITTGCFGDYEGENTPTPYKVILPLSMMTVDGWKFTLTGFNISEPDEDDSDYDYLANVKGYLEKYAMGELDSGCLKSSKLRVELKSTEGESSPRNLYPSGTEEYCVNFGRKSIELEFPISSLRNLAEDVGQFADVSLIMESQSRELIYLGQLGHLGDPKIVRATTTPEPDFDGVPNFPIEVAADINGNSLQMEINAIDLTSEDGKDSAIVFYDLINESENDICLRPEDFSLEIGSAEIPVYEDVQKKFTESLELDPITHLQGLCVKANQSVSSYLAFEVSFSDHLYDRARIVFRNLAADLGYLFYIQNPAQQASIPTETTYPSRTPEITPTSTSTNTPTIPAATQTAQALAVTQTAIAHDKTATVASYNARLTATVSAKQTQIAFSKPPTGEYYNDDDSFYVFGAGNFEYRNNIYPYSTDADSHFVVLSVAFASAFGDLFVTPVDITLVMSNNRQYHYHEATYSFSNHLESMTVYEGYSVEGVIVFLTPANSRPEKLIYDMGWLANDLVIEID